MKFRVLDRNRKKVKNKYPIDECDSNICVRDVCKIEAHVGVNLHSEYSFFSLPNKFFYYEPPLHYGGIQRKNTSRNNQNNNKNTYNMYFY